MEKVMSELMSKEFSNGKKIKTNWAEIIVRGTSDKPYFEIAYFDLRDKEWHIGFGSYYLDYVFEWKRDCFEIVDQVAAECGNDVVYNLAMSYAICLSKYGVDITEKLETTTQNAYALNQAYMRGRQEERDKFDKWREEFADDTNVGRKNGWIPCSEKLPEDGDNRFYMCIVENHEEDLPMFCQFVEELGFGYWQDIFDKDSLGFVDSEFSTNEELGYEKVIAWQPLPGPYEEKENDRL